MNLGLGPNFLARLTELHNTATCVSASVFPWLPLRVFSVVSNVILSLEEHSHPYLTPYPQLLLNLEIATGPSVQSLVGLRLKPTQAFMWGCLLCSVEHLQTKLSWITRCSLVPFGSRHRALDDLNPGQAPAICR